MYKNTKIPLEKEIQLYYNRNNKNNRGDFACKNPFFSFKKRNIREKPQ